MALYLGFDSSTQSLTATVIDVSPAARRVVFQHSLLFDKDLPRYNTTNGVRRHADPLVVTSPPLMAKANGSRTISASIARFSSRLWARAIWVSLK